ncbi:MAG TPA: dTDP-4-dehydrorhamnose reductase, partial [Elusimicrobiales bacterium]|nr:dTDP-4-dehydrorhamnose reductase [Elusimicrobiales bacterium]
ARRFEASGAEFRFPRLDISDFDSVMDAFSSYRPDAVLNCAAYNFVDKAETDYVGAYKANAFGPALLAHAARKYGCVLVHYGTDYVFDGKKRTPYVETDAPDPLNQYGRSKLAGEELVLGSGARALVLRLSWVFGSGRQNFVSKLREWAAGGGPLRIADDEVSVPTYAGDVADITLKAIDQGLSGVYHLVNSGFCSRYDWAAAVLKELKLSNPLERASSADFKPAAKRPPFSAMSNARLSGALGTGIRDWRDALSAYLREEAVS